MRVKGNGGLLLGQPRALTRKKAQTLVLYRRFLRAIGILTNIYAVSPERDQEKFLRRALQSANRHITAVWSRGRLFARTRWDLYGIV